MKQEASLGEPVKMDTDMDITEIGTSSGLRRSSGGLSQLNNAAMTEIPDLRGGVIDPAKRGMGDLRNPLGNCSGKLEPEIIPPEPPRSSKKVSF